MPPTKLHKTLKPFWKVKSPKYRVNIYRISKQRKSRTLAAHGILVQQAIREHLYLDSPESSTPELYYGSNGEPLTSSKLIKISVSHSARLLAIGCSTSQRIGIDLQDDKNITIEQSELFLQDSEIRLKGYNPMLFWSAKEAYLKSTHEGLSRSIKSITVSSVDDRIITVYDSEKAIECVSSYYEIDNHYLVIADY